MVKLVLNNFFFFLNFSWLDVLLFSHFVEKQLKNLQFFDQRGWVLVQVNLLDHDSLLCQRTSAEKDLALSRAD
jgi:hypothetical protein